MWNIQYSFQGRTLGGRGNTLGEALQDLNEKVAEYRARLVEQRLAQQQALDRLDEALQEAQVKIPAN